MNYEAHLRGASAPPTKVFEPPDKYFDGNRDGGYWGPVTATVDWCEHNYVHSVYIAEFWNTLSNIGFILFGLYGLRMCWLEKLERRFVVVYASIVVVGAGSAAYHCTLTKIGQQGDETPMVLAMLGWLFSLIWEDPAFEERHATRKVQSAYGMACLGLL